MRMFSGISPQNALRMALLMLAALVFFYQRQGMLPHQLAGSPLFDISLDNTFWIFHMTGFPSWLNRHTWALWSMEMLFLATAAMLFFKYRPSWVLFFLALMVTLSLFMQSYSCVLTKISVILPVVFIPYCFRGELFQTALKFPRYYLVYLMVSAALFKIVNGGLAHPGQMQAILWNQHSDLVFYGSRHVSALLASFIGSAGWSSAIAYIAIFAIEFSFLLVLFTRKLDHYFAVLLLFFCAAIYLVMRINTLEMIFLIIPLLNISAEND